MANRISLRKAATSRYIDFTLLLTIIFLIIFGLVVLLSVGSYDGSISYGDSAYYFKKQAISTALGLVVMVVVSFIPFDFWERFAVPFYFAALALLLLIIPFGVTINGAKRWIPVFGISIQPAEIAKLAIIISIAHLVYNMGPKLISTWKGFLIVMVATAPMCLAIYFITSNLSSAIIVFGIAFMMCFVVSPDYKKFIIVVLSALVIAGIYVLIIANGDKQEINFRAERILAWLDPNKYAAGKGFQTLQALYAIGSGGFFGKGIGQSMQKLGYLPEAQNDMIFSIICEELGFFGALCVILLFLLLIWRCVLIVNRVNDMYGALLIVGFTSHIAIQVILNIAVVTNLIPNTGISLPFVSYGGSSVVSLLFEVGLVFSVQRRIYIRE